MMNKAALSLVLLTCLLAGCVTESSVTDKSVPGKREVGPHEAARTRLSLALNYMQNGDMTQAKFNLMKAAELDPDSAEVANAFAYFYQQVGENELAEQSYRKAIRADGNNADSYNNFGAFLCQIGKFAQAEELLLDAIKQPNYIRVAESYENLGLCALDANDISKAERYFSAALKHSPVNGSVLYDLALVSYAKSEFSQAQNWFSKLQKTGQSSPAIALLRYLIAVQQQDDRERALAEKFLLSAYPNSPEALQLLSGSLKDTSAEKLRQRYLQQQGDLATAPLATSSPKIKVVKRKSSTESSASPLQRPTEHIVRAGETLYTIASLYRLTVSELQRLNQLSDGDDVAAGQIIVLPAAPSTVAVKQYQVADGDTLFSIAYRFNMSVERLCQLNQLSPSAAISAGTILKLQDPND